jgi:glycine/serine hydroxymethyltransferase
MEIVGRLIITVLKNHEDAAALERVSAEVRDLCGRFPVPGIA